MGPRQRDLGEEMDHHDDDHDDRPGVGRWLLLIIAIAAPFYFGNRPGPAKSFAGGGWSNEWNAAVQKSVESGKPALVLFTANWCPGCRSFETNVLARPDIRRYLESRYTLVMIDLSRRDSPNQAVAEQYNIQVLPTLILYNRGGGETARCYSLSADNLIKWLRSDGRDVKQYIVE